MPKGYSTVEVLLSDQLGDLENVVVTTADQFRELSNTEFYGEVQ